MRIFNIDITRKGISPVVQVTEHDAMSRFFTLILRNGNADYEPPENPSYSVWYKTKDSTGWYDTIEEPDNGTHPAVVASGNMFTIEIAEAATTSCGELALMITGDDGYQLTVTGIITQSADIPGYDSSEVENYYNVYITEMRENAARAENAADIAVAYGATVEVDEEAQQLNITHHSDTEGGVGWLFGSAVESSASGDPATFSDGANDVAVKSLVAEITPVQSGSGDPSPMNIRPISGRTGMTVTAAGKNICPVEKQPIIEALWGSDVRGMVAFLNTLPAGTYTLSNKYRIVTAPTSGNGVQHGALYVTAIINGAQTPVNTYSTATDASPSVGKVYQESTTFTITDAIAGNINHCYVYCDSTTHTGTGRGTYECYDIQLEVGNTASAYEPYHGATYPISWQTQAGTVYGGTLDVVSGVLTVDRAYAEFDGSDDENWLFSPNNALSYIRVSGGVVTGASTQYKKYVESNIFKGTSWADRSGTGTVCMFYGASNICVKYSDFTSVADLKAYIAEHPLQVVYKLATPQTYQLTPTEVRTILGGNNIYTDAGAVSVEYVADTKLYIDNKVAELQALILEN